MCDGIRYLTCEDIVAINRKAISFTPEETHGFQHKNNLEPAQQSPAVYRYYKQCEDIFILAAQFYIKINKSHIFENANKRTAFIASVVFLRINGFDFQPCTDSSIEVAVEVAKSENGGEYLNPVLLSSWFEGYSKVLVQGGSSVEENVESAFNQTYPPVDI